MLANDNDLIHSQRRGRGWASTQEHCWSVMRESRKASLRCAIYTRISTQNGLEQEFNSLDNQREASEAYIRSQAHEGGN